MKYIFYAMLLLFVFIILSILTILYFIWDPKKVLNVLKNNCIYWRGYIDWRATIFDLDFYLDSFADLFNLN